MNRARRLARSAGVVMKTKGESTILTKETHLKRAMQSQPNHLMQSYTAEGYGLA